MRLPVPTPLAVLVAGAVVANTVPGVGVPPAHVVIDIVSVALVAILFAGGRDIGWTRARAALRPIVVVGVAGTFLTTVAAAALVHFGFGLSWFVAALIATAIAPTDPAVVFSVLGGRTLEGRSGTILEGESGANDPVGIALMASLLEAGSLDGSAAGQIAITFVLQLTVGLAIGVAGGLVIRAVLTRVRLRYVWLHPVGATLVVAAAFLIATAAHGSGFLAVFVAGIASGDPESHRTGLPDRVHDVLGRLGEFVAFALLGLTIRPATLVHADVLWPGLLLAVVLAVVIRPIAAGMSLAAARLGRNELAFVLFAGLKGAVPLLLGQLFVDRAVPQAARAYGIVVVVVVFSVLVQGSLTVPAARRLKLLSARRTDGTGC